MQQKYQRNGEKNSIAVMVESLLPLETYRTDAINRITTILYG